MIRMTLMERLSNTGSQALGLMDDLPIGYVTAAIVGFFQPLFNLEMDFIAWLSILLFTDVALGFWKHFRAGTISRDGFSKVFDKLFVVVGSVIVIQFIVGWQGNNGYFGQFFETGGHFTLLWWIGWSVLENIYIISGEKFPPKSWLDLVKRVVAQKSNNNDATDEKLPPQ